MQGSSWLHGHSSCTFHVSVSVGMIADVSSFLKTTTSTTTSISSSELSFSHMSSYQLGHDRTARLLDGHSYYQDQYPSFLVSLGGDGNTMPQWKTSGPPI